MKLNIKTYLLMELKLKQLLISIPLFGRKQQINLKANYKKKYKSLL
ncbi:TPA: hypothetical protein ACXDA2_003944 [Clostridium botulinum]